MSRHIKGQFWVEDIGMGDPNLMKVPIDNFVFYAKDGWSCRLSIHGGRIIVGYGKKRIKEHWFNTYTEGLGYMAYILENKGVTNGS